LKLGLTLPSQGFHPGLVQFPLGLGHHLCQLLTAVLQPLSQLLFSLLPFLRPLSEDLGLLPQELRPCPLFSRLGHQGTGNTWERDSQQ
jgi:hypothetical protein